MAELTGKDKAEYIQGMLTRLAGKYDCANRWMTWWQDIRWRREVIRIASLPHDASVLDIGAGTGDLVLEAIRQDGSLRVVAGDFTPAMLEIGRKKDGAGAVGWMIHDALAMPFVSNSFDAVVSSYLMRNVIDARAALEEQYRVLKVGGKMVGLDTSPPPADTWHLPVHLYLQYVIPTIGGLVTGDRAAYRYLPKSTQRFLTAQELAHRMERVGFRQVGFRCFMGGSMAIHWGIK